MENNYSNERNRWLIFEDTVFLKSCKTESFQSTGPGGQKKNKKFSAIRMTHIPTEVTVISDNYREQNINKKIAIKKLKIKIAINIRGPKIELDRTIVSSSSDDYPLWIAKLFDILNNNKYDIKTTAVELSLTTSKLIKLIYKDKTVWKTINDNRILNDIYPLNPPK